VAFRCHRRGQPTCASAIDSNAQIASAHQIKKRAAKDLLAISKKLKPNEKILIRVYSQGRSGYVALEAK
jgi:hypothetical protein